MSHTSNSVRAATLAALTATFFGLGACSQNTDADLRPPAGSDSSPGQTSTADAQSALGIDSLLQAYRLTEQEFTTVGYARLLFIRDCMKGFGFDYPEPKPFSEVLEQDLAGARVDNKQLYGVPDADWARQYGYGRPPRLEVRADETDETPQTPAYLFTLYGTKDLSMPAFGQTESPGEVDGKPIPGGGCAGEAARHLDDTDPDISSYGLAHTLWLEGIQKRFASEDHRTVAGEWKACLAEAGYHITDFGDTEGGDIGRVYQAREAAGDEDFDDPPSPAEVALALADVRCKEEVDFVARLSKVQRAIDEQTIKDNELVLEEDRKRLDKQVREATRLVEGAGS